MRHRIERALDLDLTESFDKEMAPSIRQSNITGGFAANCSVERWRVPRTLCTVSWADGSLTRAFMTIRQDCMTEAQRKEANEAQKGNIIFLLFLFIYTYNLSTCMCNFSSCHMFLLNVTVFFKHWGKHSKFLVDHHPDDVSEMHYNGKYADLILCFCMARLTGAC